MSVTPRTLSGEVGYIDGNAAGDNYNTVTLLYYDKVVYCENTSGEWYAWSGSAWKSVSGDPTSSSSKAFSESVLIPFSFNSPSTE